MKKTFVRLQVILLLIVVSISLTGCMRMNVTFDIKSNGKADVSMIYALSSSMMSEDDKSTTDKEMQEMKDQGWECEKYEKDDFYGYSAKKSNIKMSDMKEIFSEAETDISGEKSSGPTLLQKGFKYIFDWTINEEESLSSYKEYMEMSGGYATVTMTLPYKPKNNNATRVSEDGKTLTWDLLEMNAGDTIHVEFSLINKKLVIACIIIVVIILGAIAVIIFLKKQKQETVSQTVLVNNTSNNEPESDIPMKFCGYCGKKIPESALFCSGCGKPTNPSNDVLESDSAVSQTTIESESNTSEGE